MSFFLFQAGLAAYLLAAAAYLVFFLTSRNGSGASPTGSFSPRPSCTP